FGLTREDNAFFFELAFDGKVIFNDAVMDDRDQTVAADMGMGILVSCRTVCCPARMADADRSGRWPLAQQRSQLCDPAGAFAQVQLAVHQGCQAGAIVTAI